jgi:hypothetical protein
MRHAVEFELEAAGTAAERVLDIGPVLVEREIVGEPGDRLEAAIGPEMLDGDDPPAFDVAQIVDEAARRAGRRDHGR